MSTTKTPTRRTSVSSLFKNWLGVKDEAAQLTTRQTELRDSLLGIVAERGESDENGSAFIDLPEPIEFLDFKGNTVVYGGIKRERYVTPAQPTPDPELAEDLLRERKLWLTKAQEKVIRDLNIALPYVSITVEVDVDAIAGGYFQDVFTEDEYADILVPQKENFRFVPVKD